MTSERSKCTLVTGTSVLVNLIHVDRLGLLGRIFGHEFVVPPEVEAEISVPAHCKALARATDAGHIKRRAFTGPDELALYTKHAQVIGSGEAACLAMAEIQRWYIASDERRKFLKLAIKHLGPGRVLNTPGVFVLAIHANLITEEEADQDKLLLEEHRFKMGFSSFREVASKETGFRRTKREELVKENDQGASQNQCVESK